MSKFTKVFIHEAREKEPFSVGEYGQLDVEYGDVMFDGVKLSPRLAERIIRAGVNYCFTRKAVTAETKKEAYVQAHDKLVREWKADTVILRGEGKGDEITALERHTALAWIKLTSMTVKKGELSAMTRVELALEQLDKALNGKDATALAHAAMAGKMGARTLANEEAEAAEFAAARIAILGNVAL